MIPKVAAFWLVALVLLPFTAPFPTCGFDDFLGRTSSGPVPVAPPASTASLADATASLLVLPLTPEATRLRLVALLMFNTRHAVSSPSPTVRFERSVASAGSFGRQPAQVAILRL